MMSDSGDLLLLEIGTEELPAGSICDAVNQLAESISRELVAKRITHGRVKTFATPRRLAVQFADVAVRQEDLREKVKGPPASIAYDEQGNPTEAARGFARSQGVDLTELFVEETPGGSYVFAERVENGDETRGILPALLADAVTSITFPRSMRWGDQDLRFARPIRWLLGLFGDEVISFSVAGVTSGRETRGHRFLSSGPLEITHAAEYEQKLKEGYVIPDFQERREIIRNGVEEAARKDRGMVLISEELLDEVTNLVEYPTPVSGEFPKEYLQLPEAVLFTPMRVHQRYFPVVDESGRPLPRFIAVRNGDEQGLELVKEGNEKVLEARLEDARFYYELDCKRPLAGFADQLEGVLFQEQLGSMADKTKRIHRLCDRLCTVLCVDKGLRDKVLRAASLCKADLVTAMVGDFPELQGEMGRIYALKSGEDPAVATAIFEHYLPRYAGDVVPGSKAGIVLSLADKLDTITGCFGVGMIPSGSQDPYALRRQALGIVNIVLQHNLALNMDEMVAFALDSYEASFDQRKEETRVQVLEFLRKRFEGVLADRGIRYDVVNCVISTAWEDMADAALRAETVQRVLDTEFFADVLVVYERVSKLGKEATVDDIDPGEFQESAEKELFDSYRGILKQVEPLIAGGKYERAIRIIADLRPTVDRFFDEVLVMHEDAGLRSNRQALLKGITELIERIGDLSQVVLQ